MLHCRHCRYELTGLARGPEDVLCPECGLRTPHVDGEPRVDDDIFVAMGDDVLPYVFTPALVAALVLCVIAAMQTPWMTIAGAAVILGVWIRSAVRVRRAPSVQGFTPEERHRLSIHVLVMSFFASVISAPVAGLLLMGVMLVVWTFGGGLP